MRLTCPNCDAQYEVPDDVIPAVGRDVQCSNCGNTWFQTPPQPASEKGRIGDALVQAKEKQPEADIKPVAAAPAQPPEPEEMEVAPAASQAAPHPEPIEEPQEAEAEAEDSSEEVDLGGADWDLDADAVWGQSAADASTSEDDFDENDFVETPPLKGDAERSAKETEDSTAPTAQRRGLDDAVADILREEAAFESQARAAEEPQSLETQEEMALPEGRETSFEPVEERLDRVRDQDETRAQASNTNMRSTRRDLLPDIEEINSTLRSSDKTSGKTDQNPAQAVGAKRSRGFRLGFVTVLLIAVAAIYVYGSHDTLSARYPSAAPYIETYMDTANQTRIWLDDKVTLLLLKINELTE